MLIKRECLAAALAATTDKDTRYFLNAVQVEPPAPLTDIDRCQIAADYYRIRAESDVAATDEDAAEFVETWIQENPRGARAVATNGHVLIIATDNRPTADNEFPAIPNSPETHGEPTTPILIGADIAQRLIKGTAQGKRNRLPVLECIRIAKNGEDGAHVVTSTDLTAPTITTIHKDDIGTFPAYDRVIPKVSRTRPTVRVCLAVDVLETLIKAAKIAKGTGKHCILAFDIPIGPKDRAGAITGELCGSGDVGLTFVAMPCRS
jgi:hypothetical protein